MHSALILLIDNFDSFTHNLQDYLLRFHKDVLTVRYNDLEALSWRNKTFDGIVISPGPGHPKEYPDLFAILEHFEGRIPILGVCLGHQAIGLHYGGRLTKAKIPMHGKVSDIVHQDSRLYLQVPTPTQVTRYHSLVLTQLPACLQITSHTLAGEVMSLEHIDKPIWGLQYHPEALLTEYGEKVIENFTNIVSNWNVDSVIKQNTIAGTPHLPKKETCW